MLPLGPRALISRSTELTRSPRHFGSSWFNWSSSNAPGVQLYDSEIFWNVNMRYVAFCGRSGSTSVPVTTRMGECLLTGRPKQPDQLSLPSLWSRLAEYRPVWLGLRWGVFTRVGWKVTLCDHVWQVTPPSCERTCSGELYRLTVLFNEQ